MRILGIDPGYGIIGYGVIDKTQRQMVAVDYGVIQTPKDKSIPIRLDILYKALSDIIRKYKPMPFPWKNYSSTPI